MYANLAASLRDGSTTTLPALAPGDIITVPMGAVGGVGGALGEGVGVIGEVTKPGVYPVGPGQDLWSVLALAGGPTQNGDLSNVRIITREGLSQAVVKLNLKETLDRGKLRPQLVKAGDVVYVSSTAHSGVAQAFGGFQTLLAITRDILNIIVLEKVLNEHNTNP